MHSNAYNVRPHDKFALRVKEAANLSGLSRSTLYKLLSARKLRDVKIGGRRLILREDLKALLRSGTE